MPSGNQSAPYFVGVELGGTKIRAGVCCALLRLRRKVKLSTKADRGAPAVIKRIARAVRDAVDEADLNWEDIRGVGVGAPGSVDAEAGEVLLAPSLGWSMVPLRASLEKELGLPVFVENDGLTATLGVHLVELKSKPATMLGLFVGSSISGGLVVNGRVYRGGNGMAGALGHMVVAVGGPKCACGNRGCLEALASRSAIMQAIRAAAKAGQPTLLTTWLGDDLKGMRCSDLRKALRGGDTLVESRVEEAGRHIGIAVGSLINLVNPEVVALGGGVIEALAEKMVPIIRDTARDYVMPGAFGGIKIQTSALGDAAGILGGAWLARQWTSQPS